MRVFDHPNQINFMCPICGKNEDKPVVLVGIVGTQEGGIEQAEQFHLDCLHLLWDRKYSVVYQFTKPSYDLDQAKRSRDGQV